MDGKMNKKKLLTRNGISYSNYVKINRNSSTGNTRGNINIESKYLNKENYLKNSSNISNKDYSENNSKREEELKKVNNHLLKKCTKSFNNEPIKTGLTFESLLLNKDNKQNIIKQNSAREKKINNMINQRKHKNKSLDYIDNFKRENLNFNNSKIKEKIIIEKRKNYNKTINNDDNFFNRKYLNQNDKFKRLYNEDIEQNKYKIHLSDKNTIEKKDFTFGNFLSFREGNFQKEKKIFENNSQRVNKIDKENKHINKNLELSNLTELDYRIENIKKNLNSLNLIELMSEDFSNYKINENNNEIDNIDELLTNVKISNDNFYKEINKKLKNIEEILTYK